MMTLYYTDVSLRFLRVKPATEQDVDLLSHLLSYLTTLLENSDHSHRHQQGSSDCYPAISGGNDRGGGQVTRQLQQLFGGAVFLRWLGEETAGEESACLQTLRSLLETHGDHNTRDRYICTPCTYTHFNQQQESF